MKLYKIQESLYQFLSKNLSVPVENRIDLDTPKPYVAMADINLRRENARKLEGFNLVQELVVFSNFNGKDEVIKITDEIRELVSEYEIEIENVNVHTQTISSIAISQFDVKIYEGQIMLNLEIFEY